MVRLIEALEDSWPAGPEDESWADFTRKMTQAGINHNPDVIRCSICNESITSEKPLINSHTVSEPQLEIIANDKSKVSFLDYKLAISRDFKDIRKAHSRDAGVRRFAHGDCDHKEFAPYEGGDYSSQSGARSLVSKILHSAKSSQTEFLLRQTGELREAFSGIANNWKKVCLDVGFDYPTYLAEWNRLKILFSIEHFNLWQREMPMNSSIKDWIIELGEEKIVFRSKVINSPISIASQGMLLTKYNAESPNIPLFFALLPLKDGTYIFFLGAFEKHSFLLKWAEELPLIAFLWSMAYQPKALFWDANYKSSLIDLFISNHGHAGLDLVDWSDTNAAYDLIPKNINDDLKRFLMEKISS